MNDENTAWKATGKRVLTDAVLLAKDTGAFIYEFAKHVAALIKTALKTKDDDSKCEPAK